MFSKEFKQAVNELINDYNLDIILLIAVIIFGIYIFFVAPKIYVNSTDAVVDGRLINVTSRAGGQISQVYALKDSEVKKGDLLMEIDSTEYQNELIKLETSLQINKEKLKMFGISPESLQDNQPVNPNEEQTEDPDNNTTVAEPSNPPKYKKGTNDITKYSRTYEPEDLQAENLQKKKIAMGEALNNMSNPVPDVRKIAVPSIQIDKSKIDISKDTAESVKKEIKEIEKQEEEIKLLIYSTKIFAPRDGTVSSVSVNVGDVVNPSDVLCTLIPKQVWIIARVNPSKLSQVKVGQSVRIKIPLYKRRVFKGTVSSVDKTLKVYQVNAEDQVVNVNSEGFVENEPTPAYQIKIDFAEDYSDFNIPPDTNVQAKILVR